jgi:membrane protein YdbS with pleckstrin-like domain
MRSGKGLSVPHTASSISLTSSSPRRPPQTDHDLLKTEEPVAKVHRHWLAYFDLPWKPTVVALLVAVVFLAFGPLPFRLLTLAVLVFAAFWRYKIWRDDELVLTDRRVLRRHGYFTTARAHISLLRVTDVTTVRTPLGKLFNYGSVDIESASNHPALSRINFLYNPDEFFQKLTLQVYGRAEDFPEGAASAPGPGSRIMADFDTDELPKLPPTDS